MYITYCCIGYGARVRLLVPEATKDNLRLHVSCGGRLIRLERYKLYYNIT